MFLKELLAAAEIFSVEFNSEQLNQFDDFYKLVLDWNKKINLTTIIEPKDFAVKHIIDSISIWNDEIFSEVKTVIDVGTGAGFPGIPLKIFKPNLKITLLDSLSKRTNFLTKVINELNLKKITVIHSRAEDAAQNPEIREKFDLSVSRAVAKLNILSEYCLPFVKIDGYFAALKSTNIETELKASKNAIKILGGNFYKNIEIKLPNDDPRNLIYIKKILTTPKNFPRRAGTVEKKPLT